MPILSISKPDKLYVSNSYLLARLTPALWNSAPYALAFLIALIMGGVISIGKPIAAVLLAGAIVAAFLMLQPATLLWMILFMTLVVAGTIQYFMPSLERIWWAPYGMSALLFIPAVMAYVTRDPSAPASSISPPLRMALLLLAIAAFSTLINMAPAWQIVVSVKSLFLFGGIWIALAILPLSPQLMRRWLIAFVAIGALEWLPALYQYLFVRAARISSGLGTVEASDSVVGTFGGSMESGGLTANLGAYCVILIIIALAYVRGGLIKRSTALWLIISLAIPLFLMEVKVVFVYLPVSLFILYKDVIWHRPMTFIGGAIAALLLLGGLLVSYQALHWSAKSGNLTQNLQDSFTYSFKERVGEHATEIGRMSRFEALEFWWQKHSLSQPLHLFFGHGLGASRTPGLAVGSVAAKYSPMQIDITGLALFLWDLGVIGVGLFVAMLYSGYRLALRLSLAPRLEPWQRALARGLHATIPLFFISLSYRRDIPYAPPMMFIFMTIFGLLSWLYRQERVKAASATKPASKPGLIRFT